jgi:hypothetical protein
MSDNKSRAPKLLSNSSASILFIALILTLCGYILAPRREEKILTASDSPDGKYRCVVVELSPPVLSYSPWMYTFTIKDRDSGRELSGKPFANGNDSAMIGADQLKFEWSGDEVKIDYSQHPYLKAKIRGRVQEWEV